MAGKSGQKSRLSGRRGAEGRATPAKRQKGIKQFLQPRPPPPQDARDSSEEPDEQAGPSQTPAVGLLAAAAVPPTAGAPTGAGAMLQTALLRSLQHRFATQQALETPALAGASGSSTQLAQQGAAPMDVQQQQAQPPPQQAQQQEVADEDEDDEDEDGFQIFSQLAYEPTFLSQRPPEPAPDPDGGPAGTSQQPTQTQLPPSQQGAQPPAGPAITTADEEGDGEWPASQLLSQPAASQQPVASQQAQQADGARRVSGAPKTTPALHSSERIRCDDGQAEDKPAVFHLFRTRAGTKRVYIVRHGESAYNEAVARGASWADPLIFDARLTEKGRQQARKLRSELAQLNLPADTLWVTSPLSRAIETLLLGCPTAHLLRQAPGGGAAAGSSAPSASTASASTENSAAAPNGGSDQPPRIVVLPCISEKVVTCGDIGHPASVLCKRFPELAEPLDALPELWWYTGKPGKPNCALQKRFESHETKQQVDVRVGAFRKWLQDRPETTIVAVGHSSYWRSFEEACKGVRPERMRNCEFRCILF